MIVNTHYDYIVSLLYGKLGVVIPWLSDVIDSDEYADVRATSNWIHLYEAMIAERWESGDWGDVQ